MRERAVFGWLLAGAFCVSLSCSGGHNSATPQGFGLACTTNKTCTTYDLLCGPEGKCVECLDANACKSDEVCSLGLCVAAQDCKDSRDCAGDQVCDDQAGICVDCVGSRDCKTAQKCDANACVDRPACGFTSDCKGGLVCDVDMGACVTCRDNSDCDSRRICVDYECVSRSTSSSGGSGSAMGGMSSAGDAGKTSVAGTSTGGQDFGGSVSFGGRAGAGSGGGKGGASGSGGVSGAGGGDACGCAITQVCTEDLRCVAPTLIDDLVDCDDKILAIEGRSGDWAADADTGIELSYGFGDPGANFDDQTCAAWAAGTEATLNDPDATFAFSGFLLNDGLPYDLSPYNGLQILLEAPTTYVQVVLKTSGGGYFQFTLNPISGATSYLRSAPFSSMLMMENSAELVLDPSTVTEVQFSVTTPSSFKFAVHKVSLY